MRSNLVFGAMAQVENPFLLCHLVRVSSRSCHKNGVAMQDTINKVLVLLSQQDRSAQSFDRKVAFGNLVRMASGQ